MKSLWKLTAVAAVSLAGSLAQADVVLPNTATGSSLVLFVRDITPGANPNRVYARDLNISLDTVLTQAGASGTYSGPGQSIPYVLPTIGPDAALTAFLGSSPNPANFVWTIMAGDTVGNLAFQQRYLSTTQLDTSVIPSNSTLRGVFSQLNGMLTELNTVLPDSAGSSTGTDGQWGQTGGPFENAIDWFAANYGNQNALGDAANLFVLATSATNNPAGNVADSRIFAATRVVLSASGELSSVIVAAPVPLPPALYLLGSAIAGLTGVARRKKLKVA